MSIIRTGILVLAAALSGAAWAPVGLTQAEPSPVEQPGVRYSEVELLSFAQAAREVKRINLAYLLQLHATGNAEELQQVREEALQEIRHAVEDRGMSVERYQEILASALADPDLAERVNKYLEGTPV